MKTGTLALAGVIALLAVPPSASGGADALGIADAAHRGGLQVSFTLRSRGGEPVALRRFRFSQLPAACAGGIEVQVGGFIRRIRVNDRNRFHKTLRRPGKRVRVRGRVSGDLDTVRGTIRAEGAYGEATNCDSGRVDWVAR